MIETALIGYLDDKLDVYVGMEAPEDTAYVLVDKTGSRHGDKLHTATFAIQSYGASLYDALLLNEEVKDAMEDLTGDGDIFRAHLETDYNFTNTATKQYRWQAVYEITYHE